MWILLLIGLIGLTVSVPFGVSELYDYNCKPVDTMNVNSTYASTKCSRQHVCPCNPMPGRPFVIYKFMTYTDAVEACQTANGVIFDADGWTVQHAGHVLSNCLCDEDATGWIAPNDHSFNEQCMMVRKHGKYYRKEHVDCHSSMPVICRAPYSRDVKLRIESQKRFFIIENSTIANYAEANSICIKNGGLLAQITVDDAVEINQHSSFNGSGVYWIQAHESDDCAFLIIENGRIVTIRSLQDSNICKQDKAGIICMAAG